MDSKWPRYVRIVVGNNIWIQRRRTIVIYICRCSELDCGQWGVLDCCTLRYPAMGLVSIYLLVQRHTNGRSEQGQIDRQTGRHLFYLRKKILPVLPVQLGNNSQAATADRLEVFSRCGWCAGQTFRGGGEQMWNIYIYIFLKQLAGHPDYSGIVRFIYICEHIYCRSKRWLYTPMLCWYINKCIVTKMKNILPHLPPKLYDSAVSGGQRQDAARVPRLSPSSCSWERLKVWLEGGTSRAGFFSKNPSGLSMMLILSAGMMGKSSGRGLCVRPNAAVYS